MEQDRGLHVDWGGDGPSADLRERERRGSDQEGLYFKADLEVEQSAVLEKHAEVVAVPHAPGPGPHADLGARERERETGERECV